MARRRDKSTKQQQTKAWNTWNIIIFGFFIACLVGIVTNFKVAKSKTELEPESEEKLDEEILRMLRAIPNKTESIPTQNCHFASSEGRRPYQEDREKDTPDRRPSQHPGANGLEEVRVGAVAVFDGHIGSAASEMASNIFLDKFLLNLNNSIEQSSNLKELLKSSLVTTINDIDAEFSEAAFKFHFYAGSTAVVALIYDNHVLVANVGDSKAFLCSQKKISQEAGTAGLLADELTRDHNAHRLDERARIEASGGVFKFVHNFVPLLMGHFPMTRAIGDVPLKRYGIIANPEMTDWRSLTSKDEFLVVASDGIFESLAPQEVFDFLNVKDHSDPSLLAEQLIQKAYLEGSYDNLSVVLVPLGSGGDIL